MSEGLAQGIAGHPPRNGQPRVGVFICHCGGNVSDTVDVDRVVRETASLPGVICATAHTLSQLRFLQLVGLGEVHTVCDAAALLGESHGAASKMAEKLVRRDLLRRAALVKGVGSV